jgi:hypothetical protein
MVNQPWFVPQHEECYGRSMSSFIEAAPEFRLVLLPAPENESLSSAEYQKELSDLLASFKKLGIRVTSSGRAFDALHGLGGLSGEFIFNVTASLASAAIWKGLEDLLATFLHRNSSRKVRVDFRPDGRLKSIEAQSISDVTKVIEASAEYFRRTVQKHDR